MFATIDDGGYIFVWDNNDLSLITKCSSGTQIRTKGCCVTIADDGCIVGGFEDGFIRAFNTTKQKFSPVKWEIVNAHKGRVSAIYCVHNIYKYIIYKYTYIYIYIYFFF